MLRQSGQKSLICDGCKIIYDDRPRYPKKDVLRAAWKDGWIISGAHLCPACALCLNNAVGKWRFEAMMQGPLHSNWDVIFDAEALLRGDETAISAKKIVAMARNQKKGRANG